MKHLRTYGHVLLVLGALTGLLALAPTAFAAPANDGFASATAIAPDASVSLNNEGATKESGEPSHAGNAGGHSVWFSWTPAKSGRAGVNTSCFGTLDVLIGVYTGPSVGSLAEVASNENGPAPLCFSTTAEVEFDVSAGTTYWIAIDGADGSEGYSTLTLRGVADNDDFAAATALPAALPQTAPGSTKFASKESGEPNHAADLGGHSVWYSWTPDASRRVEISTCTNFMSSTDTLLAVYTGSALGALTQVAANDDASEQGAPGCSWLDSGVELDAVAGTTYRIAVDGAGESSTTFNLRLRAEPANDGFASPQELGSTLPAMSSQVTNRLASKESGEPDHAGDPGGRSIWFSWTPTTSARVAAVTCTHEPSGQPDTLLGVYTGSTLGTLSAVGSNDDAAVSRCGDTDSVVAFDAVAGTTYRIAVDAKGGGEGRFDLNIEKPGANDDFGSAEVLAPGLPSFSGLGSSWLASKQAGEPDHAGEPGGHSVWYSWTPASSGQVSVSVCPYGDERPDTLLGVYTGAAADALTQVAANDDSPAACRAVGSVAKLNAVAGTTYRIAVDSKAAAAGMFSLEISPPEPNDDFADAKELLPLPLMSGGSTLFATKQAGEPNHAGNAGGRSVWFSWTPDETVAVDLVACGKPGGVDTLLGVYTGNAVNALTPVAGNDDAPGKPANEFCEGAGGISEVEFNAVAGTTYRIAVDAKGGTEGRVGLAFEFTPANDDFAAAQSLFPDLPSSGGSVTKLATKQAGEPNHAGNAGGHSVWYSWTPSKSGLVDISTCVYTGGLDTLLAVYTGGAVNALAPIGSSDDSSTQGCRGSDSSVRLDAVAGTTYRIAVDGKAGSVGGFSLSIDGAAPNDAFGKPRAFGAGLPVSEWSSNRFATKQSGEPDHAGAAGDASVWFKWSASSSGKVSVDTCGSGIDTLLAVYTGPAVDDLTQVAANDDGSGKCGPQSKLSFDAVANTVYRIAVDGKAGAEGFVRIRIDGAPGNDDFAAAPAIPGTLGWYWPGSTTLASKQAGEPNHAGDAGGHSVWYSWTPKQSWVTELNVCTDSFDPLLGVYTGSAVGGLAAVANTDLGSGECEAGRALRFAAVAGTTYRFAVDGVSGDDGEFQLHLTGATTNPRMLTVTKSGSGSGSVSSSPAGIACGTICSQAYEAGSVITLTATPEGGSTFLGWSGGGCSGTGSCQVTLNADTTVVASFQAPAGGGGSGGGGGGAGPGPTSKPKPPVRCKPGFKKVKVKGKQKCVKKKKPGKHKGRGKGQGQKK